MKIHEIVIQAGENIKDVISKFVMGEKWERAIITGAIGSASKLKLANPVNNELPPIMKSQMIEGPCEVLNFTGEIMKRELMDECLKEIYPDKISPLFVHIHMSCSVMGARIYGGGLHDGYAFREIKVFAHKI